MTLLPEKSRVTCHPTPSHTPQHPLLSKENNYYCFHVPLCTNLLWPFIKEFLSVEFLTEAVTIRFQPLSLNMIFPAFSKNIFHTSHVCWQLAINLMKQEWLLTQASWIFHWVACTFTFFNPLLSVWRSDETLFLVFDVLHLIYFVKTTNTFVKRVTKNLTVYAWAKELTFCMNSIQLNEFCTTELQYFSKVIILEFNGNTVFSLSGSNR